MLGWLWVGKRKTIWCPRAHVLFLHLLGKSALNLLWLVCVSLLVSPTLRNFPKMPGNGFFGETLQMARGTRAGGSGTQQSNHFGSGSQSPLCTLAHLGHSAAPGK